MNIDVIGCYFVMYKFFYFIGLELNVFIFFVMFLNKFIGLILFFDVDVVVIVKCDLIVGEIFDGEGGFMVWGKFLFVKMFLDFKVLFIGLVYGVKLKNVIVVGQFVMWDDVENDEFVIVVWMC